MFLHGALRAVEWRQALQLQDGAPHLTVSAS
jgi:hypothetical protein